MECQNITQKAYFQLLLHELIKKTFLIVLLCVAVSACSTPRNVLLCANNCLLHEGTREDGQAAADFQSVQRSFPGSPKTPMRKVPRVPSDPRTYMGYAL